MTTHATQLRILSKSYLSVHSADHNRRVEQAQAPADLARLAEHLPADERTLVIWICRDGMTRADVGALLRQSPRRIASRFARITRRMRTPEFALCVLHAGSWPRNMRLVAERCVLGGGSRTSAARELGVSIHTARRLHADIMAMARGARLASELNNAHSKGGDTWRGTSQIAREPRWRRSA